MAFRNFLNGKHLNLYKKNLFASKNAEFKQKSIFHLPSKDHDIHSLINWCNRKKRRNGPHVYGKSNYKSHFPKTNYPSKYSSYNYVRGIGQNREIDRFKCLSSEISFGGEMIKEDCFERLNLKDITRIQLEEMSQLYKINFTGTPQDLICKLRDLKKKIDCERNLQSEEVSFDDETSHIVKSSIKKQQMQKIPEFIQKPIFKDKIDYLSLERYYF